MDFIEGEILHIDKPLHWTSFRVVRVVRAKLCQKLKIKKIEGWSCRHTRSIGDRCNDNLYW